MSVSQALEQQPRDLAERGEILGDRMIKRLRACFPWICRCRHCVKVPDHEAGIVLESSVDRQQRTVIAKHEDDARRVVLPDKAKQLVQVANCRVGAGDVQLPILLQVLIRKYAVLDMRWFRKI